METRPDIVSDEPGRVREDPDDDVLVNFQLKFSTVGHHTGAAY